ncbi:hypothetical protein BGW37DRAFT_182399 [Umbelopsis sp. PMI_123]|nr:hypothetical protein BGW37DRAFT_182399 [Umbelopsis sp. PMI_123]
MPKNKSKLQVSDNGQPSKKLERNRKESKNAHKNSNPIDAKGNAKSQLSASQVRNPKSGKLANDPFFAPPEPSSSNDSEKNGRKQPKKPNAASNSKKDFKNKSKPYSKPQPPGKDRLSRPVKQKHDTFFAPPQTADDDDDEDRKKRVKTSTPHKGQKPNTGERKQGHQKHDTFFAPPPAVVNDKEDKEETEQSLHAEKVSDQDSLAVIETIKIPEPGETILDSQSDAAVRSGVVSVVDKTNNKRKRIKIDIVAELENDAKKMTWTGNSLGAGLEVDGWD